MLSTLARYEVDNKQAGTLRGHVVRHVLSRRTADADLQCTVTGVLYVDCLQQKLV